MPAQKIAKLHPDDRSSIQEQADAIKDQIRSIDSRETQIGETLDRGLLDRQLRKKEEILDRDERLRPKTAAEKDKMMRRAKELEAQIRKEMPSYNEMWRKPGTVEMEHAIRKHQAFEAKQGQAVREWKDIQNRLEPDDPSAGNIERLRPQ